MAVLVVVDEFDDVPYVVARVLEQRQLSKVLQSQIQGMSSAMHPGDVWVPAKVLKIVGLHSLGMTVLS